MKATHKSAVLRLPATTRALIRRESAALALSQREYILLISQMAEAIRGSILPAGTQDATALRALIDNPFLLSVAAAMAGTLWGSVKEQMENSTATDDATSKAPPAPGQPVRPAPTRSFYGQPPSGGYPYGYTSRPRSPYAPHPNTPPTTGNPQRHSYF